MAHVYEPFDLIKNALASLALVEKLPQFEQNEVQDATILQILSKQDTQSMATLPPILGVCIPVGRVPDFTEAFKKALERRKQVRAATAAHDLRAGKLIPRRTKNASAKTSSDALPPRKRALTRWQQDLIVVESRR